MNDDDLPQDPDVDDVPLELLLLASESAVCIVETDGSTSTGVLVPCPAAFAHVRRLREGFFDTDY